MSTEASKETWQKHVVLGLELWQIKEPYHLDKVFNKTQGRKRSAWKDFNILVLSFPRGIGLSVVGWCENLS